MDGPVEYLLLRFGEQGVPTELVTALLDLVEYQTVRILDIVVVSRSDGELTILEIDDLDEDIRDLFNELDGEYGALLSDRDLELVAAELPEGHTLAALVWENLWAAHFAEALFDSGGEVLAHERLPRETVELALARASEESS